MSARVAAFLRKDEGIVSATFAGVIALVTLAKLSMGGKKEEVAAPVAPKSVSSASGEVPSFGTPEFDSWIDQEGNFEKLLSHALGADK